MTDARRVFNAWKNYRPRPHLCRFTVDRQRLIRARMKLGYKPGDLIALIEYVNESDAGWPRFMRGENDRGRAYLDLDNIMRVGKLAGRIEEAMTWLEDGRPGDEPTGTWVEMATLWGDLRKRTLTIDHRDDVGLALSRRIDQHGSESVRRVFRWVWLSSDEQAAWFRSGGGRLSLVLGGRFPELLDTARGEAAQGNQERGPDPAAAWLDVLRWVALPWDRIPEPLSEDQATAAAIEAGLRVVGGIAGLKRLRQEDVARRRPTFIDAFTASTGT